VIVALRTFNSAPLSRTIRVAVAVDGADRESVARFTRSNVVDVVRLETAITVVSAVLSVALVLVRSAYPSL
jgi:hypothetical protein